MKSKLYKGYEKIPVISIWSKAFGPIVLDLIFIEKPLEPKQKIESTMQRDEKGDQSQDTSHTFIARFWLELREIKGAKPIWRGVVEHISSGQRRYLKDLDEIKEFITVHMKDTGIWPN